tara:strand:+ start:85 stop:210 length:126 start_codon:yes stop_codon:yes gene_type:complete
MKRLKMNKYESMGGIAALLVVIAVWAVYKLAILQALLGIGA